MLVYKFCHQFLAVLVHLAHTAVKRNTNFLTLDVGDKLANTDDTALMKYDTLQAKAVREAVTNMVIHSDFMVNGVLKVEKYDDCFVLTNPGLLKLPIEQIYKGGESKARNQRMQNMLRMIGYGENLGSVFPLILNAWNEKHWIKPELQEQPELMQVKLTLHIQNDVSYSSSNDPINLTERQKMILRMFSEEKNLSRERLCEKTGLSDATAKREIAFLKKAGYLERVGSLKTGHWIVVSK